MVQSVGAFVFMADLDGYCRSFFFHALGLLEILGRGNVALVVVRFWHGPRAGALAKGSALVGLINGLVCGVHPIPPQPIWFSGRSSPAVPHAIFPGTHDVCGGIGPATALEHCYGTSVWSKSSASAPFRLEKLDSLLWPKQFARVDIRRRPLVCQLSGGLALFGRCQRCFVVLVLFSRLGQFF